MTDQADDDLTFGASSAKIWYCNQCYQKGHEDAMKC